MPIPICYCVLIKWNVACFVVIVLTCMALFLVQQKLQICYNNSLRRLLSIPKRSSASEMFVNLNIPAFCELVRKYVLGFCFRLDNCKAKNLIRSIARSSVIYNSKCWQWWYKVLHWYALLYWLYYLHNFNMVLVPLCSMTVCIMFYEFVCSCCLRMYNFVIVVIIFIRVDLYGPYIMIWMFVSEINYQSLLSLTRALPVG